MPHLPSDPSGPPAGPEPARERDGKRTLGLKRVSLRRYKGPSGKDVLRTLLGREPAVDPDTGGLVLD
jgi:hypothetical protein